MFAVTVGLYWFSIRCLKNILPCLYPKFIYSVYALNSQAVEPLATYQNKRRDTHAW